MDGRIQRKIPGEIYMKVSDLKHDRLYLFRYRGYALIGKADLMINHKGDNIRGLYYHRTGKDIRVLLNRPKQHEYKSIQIVHEYEKSVPIHKIMSEHPEEFI